MSNFFEKSDLSRNEAENIISETLQKCDDGELYLENSKSESILLDDNKIKNSNYTSDLGFGFRAIYDNINPIEQKSLNEKIKILNDVNEYIRSKNNDVKQVTANFLGEQKSIEIIRSGGETLSDVRPLIRFNVSVMLEKNGRKETGVYGIGGRQSYDSYLKEDNWKNVCDEALRIASVNLESKPAPAGEMKVVLGPGWPAILIHEAVGHGQLSMTAL